MARVADYRTIADGKIEIAHQAHFPQQQFSMPDNFVRAARTVLFFNVWKDSQVDLDLKVLLNEAGQQARPEYRVLLKGAPAPYTPCTR